MMMSRPLLGISNTSSHSSNDIMIESSSSNVLLDMRQAVFSRTPFSYRVGSSTLHVQTKFISLVILGGTLFLMILFLALPSYHLSSSNLTNNLWNHGEEHGHGHNHNRNWFTHYNSTYPLTAPVFSARGYIKYRIAIISDLDTNAKHPTEQNTWMSYLKKGYITLNVENQHISSIEWDKDVIELKSHLSYGGRGMELSELLVFNGKLYSVDDRTGIIYEIDLNQNKAIPWVILTDGNGKEVKGFKSEWATVKDETLIVGGLGKEWTDKDGKMINHNPQWVKTVSTQGYIQHHDWTKNYEKIRETENIKFPGYMIHESCVWTEFWQRWIFLPRRASQDAYSEVEDELKGTNLMFKATEGFEDIKVTRVGEVMPSHGFSSFKFIPGTKDQLIIALKSEEVGGKAAAYVIVFNINGDVIYPEKKIADFKFEGIEFI